MALRQAGPAGPGASGAAAAPAADPAPAPAPEPAPEPAAEPSPAPTSLTSAELDIICDYFTTNETTRAECSQLAADAAIDPGRDYCQGLQSRALVDCFMEDPARVFGTVGDTDVPLHAYWLQADYVTGVVPRLPEVDLAVERAVTFAVNVEMFRFFVDEIAPTLADINLSYKKDDGTVVILDTAEKKAAYLLGMIQDGIKKSLEFQVGKGEAAPKYRLAAIDSTKMDFAEIRKQTAIYMLYVRAYMVDALAEQDLDNAARSFNERMAAWVGPRDEATGEVTEETIGGLNRAEFLVSVARAVDTVFWPYRDKVVSLIKKEKPDEYVELLQQAFSGATVTYAGQKDPVALGDRYPLRDPYETAPASLAEIRAGTAKALEVLRTTARRVGVGVPLEPTSPFFAHGMLNPEFTNGRGGATKIGLLAQFKPGFAWDSGEVLADVKILFLGGAHQEFHSRVPWQPADSYDGDTSGMLISAYMQGKFNIGDFTLILRGGILDTVRNRNPQIAADRYYMLNVDMRHAAGSRFGGAQFDVSYKISDTITIGAEFGGGASFAPPISSDPDDMFPKDSGGLAGKVRFDYESKTGVVEKAHIDVGGSSGLGNIDDRYTWHLAGGVLIRLPAGFQVGAEAYVQGSDIGLSGAAYGSLVWTHEFPGVVGLDDSISIALRGGGNWGIREFSFSPDSTWQVHGRESWAQPNVTYLKGVWELLLMPTYTMTFTEKTAVTNPVQLAVFVWGALLNGEIYQENWSPMGFTYKLGIGVALML